MKTKEQRKQEAKLYYQKNKDKIKERRLAYVTPEKRKEYQDRHKEKVQLKYNAQFKELEQKLIDLGNDKIKTNTKLIEIRAQVFNVMNVLEKDFSNNIESYELLIDIRNKLKQIIQE